MGYGDFEDTSTYSVPIYEMEVPESPVESGGAANRLHLYAVFRTRDADGNKIALVDALGNPVRYVDYDFVPGIWATNGKIIETTKADDKVETLADAKLSASSFWKENGLPIESYTFEMRPWNAVGSIYPVPEVGDVIPFIWSTMGVSKPLIVKSVSARMSGMDVVYKINVGGDIRLQRSAFIRISETLKDLSDVNPIPPTPSAPTGISAVANIQSATVSWDFDDTLERNKKLSAFDIQRQDGIFKKITTIQRAGSTVTITTDGSHGMVNGDKVRIQLDSSIYSTSTNKITGDWTVTSTTTTTFTYSSVTSGTIASTIASGWAIYNFCEFRTIQNTKGTYVNDNGLSPVLQYRYQVRAMSTDNTVGAWTDQSDPITPREVIATIPDGSITAAKLIASLKAIEIIFAASLPTLPSSSYTQGTIVYHLGGTPPGLKKVAVGGATWENAVGSGDIVANSITAGLISAAGLDASVIKSGALVIDSRFGVGNLQDVSYKQQALTTATLTTTTAHGYSAGNTVKVTNVGAPFDGSFTILASPAPTATKFSYTVGTSATVAETAVNPYGAALVNSGTNAITSTNFTVSNTGVITAASGTIGGWTLGSDRFTNYGGATGQYSGLIDTATTGLAFFAGATDTAGTSAKFTVSNAGAVGASALTVTGGSISIGSAFAVTSDGQVTGTGAYFNPTTNRPAIVVAGSSTEGDIAAAGSGTSATGTLNLGVTKVGATGTATSQFTNVLQLTASTITANKPIVLASTLAFSTGSGSTFTLSNGTVTTGVTGFIFSDLLEVPSLYFSNSGTAHLEFDTSPSAQNYVTPVSCGIGSTGRFLRTFVDTSAAPSAGTAPVAADMDPGNIGIFNQSGARRIYIDDFTDAVYYATTTSASDIRLKQNISNYSGALEKVLSMRPVTFNWKEVPDGKLQIGLIAQELKEIEPSLVDTQVITAPDPRLNEITDGLMLMPDVDGTRALAISAAAIKEMYAELTALKARVAELES